jgi:hypothetical protein
MSQGGLGGDDTGVGGPFDSKLEAVNTPAAVVCHPGPSRRARHAFANQMFEVFTVGE